MLFRHNVNGSVIRWELADNQPNELVYKLQRFDNLFHTCTLYREQDKNQPDTD